MNTKNLLTKLPVEPIQLTAAVATHLDQQDAEHEPRYLRRSWELQELHENTYRQFARAAGFGMMRMPSLSPDRIRLEPRRPLGLPIPVVLDTPNPANSGLDVMHNAAVLDFVDTERLGYVRNREQVAGFESHRLSVLDDRWKNQSQTGQDWQVVRLELVSLLRYEEPRVYVAENMPPMDKLAEADSLFECFERNALPQLASQKDVVVETPPSRIHMLGAVRAGKTCLQCHEGERETARCVLVRTHATRDG